MNILEFHAKVSKILNTLEFHTRIMKIIKNFRNPCENHANHENHKIPMDNQ